MGASKFSNFGAPSRFVRIGQMQGAEADGSIHRYVTEAEWRMQRRRWPLL